VKHKKEIIKNFQKFNNINEVAKAYKMEPRQVRSILNDARAEWKKHFKVKQFEKYKTGKLEKINNFIKGHENSNFYKFKSFHYTIYYVCESDLAGGNLTMPLLRIVSRINFELRLNEIKIRKQVEPNTKIERLYINIAGKKVYIRSDIAKKNGATIYSLGTPITELENISKQQMLEEL
jgi:hypothetical protein